MWALFADEEIKAGAYLIDYVGEIISTMEADRRGKNYDMENMNYLFDMTDPENADDEQEKHDPIFKKYERIFPLCIDAINFGNESRFINHSCDPNAVVFNLAGEYNINCFHRVALFAARTIKKGEEITIDYKWDKNELPYIKEDVPCMCGTVKCRKLLMKAQSRT